MTTAEERRYAIRTKYRNKVKSGVWAYDGKFDCYYETKTREWVEPKCKDKTCEFCAKRPKLAPRVRVDRTGEKK